MRDPEKWRPTRIIRDPGSGKFVTNRRGIFGGSLYIADLQHAHYIPLIEEHISGRVLDVGCGPVPYYELYKPKATEIICVDWEGSPHAKDLLDHFIDLNAQQRLPFPDGHFDSIVASDMLVHITRPHVFLAELQRILKPGGHMVITAPFAYWMGEYPHEYMHFSEFSLKHLAKDAGLETLHIMAYGGHADVLMDSLNKFFPTGFGNRVYWAFARLVRSTGWPKRNRERTKGPYALGYSMVVRKPLA